MEQHNLCFSIWYHNMLQSGKNKIHIFQFHRTLDIQRVTEISTLILTGGGARQKEQLFYLPFCRKTMFNSKKKNWRDFSLK
jgi:hypothetical protein